MLKPDVPTIPFKIGAGDLVALLEGQPLDPPKASTLQVSKFGVLYAELCEA